jgi:hypothetical protein
VRIGGGNWLRIMLSAGLILLSLDFTTRELVIGIAVI